MASQTSTTLINSLKRRDSAAWRRLAKLYGPMVYHWCRRQGLGHEDAADVVQEVYKTVAQKIASFRRDREAGSFRGWLWTITRHKLGDFFRKQQKNISGRGGTDAQRFIAELPDQPLDDAKADELVGLCRRALELIQEEFEPRTFQACIRRR